MTLPYELQAIESRRLDRPGKADVVLLCNAAYGEDVSHLFAAYKADFHVLARTAQCQVGHGMLVGHGMIVTRWLQPGDGPLLRTAYVELMATAADYRNRGIGAAMMRTLVELAAGEGYDLAALCPADTGLYRHLGWEYWQGPLFIRPGKGPTLDSAKLIPMPDERVMIHRLPGTPPLDLSQPLSAEWRPGGELW